MIPMNQSVVSAETCKRLKSGINVYWVAHVHIVRNSLLYIHFDFTNTIDLDNRGSTVFLYSMKYLLLS